MIKDLQKQNFYDAMKIMENIPGWEILEDHNFLAIKSPARIPLINMVWAEATVENIKIAKNFFADKPFSWLLTQEQPDIHLLQSGFKGPDPSPEMLIDLTNYISPNLDPAIKIIEVKTKSELYQWAQVASETFELNTYDLIDFFKPLIDVCKDIPYLALYNDEPAATSLVYCSKETAGIYAMSTLTKFRRKGLGTAAVNACLEIAKNKKMKNAVLYASAIGKFLYENIGFKTVHVLKEYFYVPTQ